MPGPVPGIHALSFCAPKTWMAGTNPAMTGGGALFNESFFFKDGGATVATYLYA